MIVTCPNCGARYRLARPVASGSRMRCAECQHRWVPETGAADAAAEDSSGAPMLVPDPPPVAADPAAGSSPTVPGEFAAPGPHGGYDTGEAAEPGGDPPRRRRWLASLAAVIAGLALSAVAAGLWIGGRMPAIAAQLPGLAVLIDTAPPLPVTLTVQGTTATLPSGRNVLEVRGTIANPTRRAVAVPPLAATLAGPDGVALRWTIAPPAPVLPPGHSVAFAATVTGFPAAATTLNLTATR